ncbi:DUF421 domain-containing protein [Tunicatimonas pelagia]|uniref:DUF421 domain-containing protein n=1 Tax=Tunicatimonas pelagia TaxID=931531 RepID=UPI002666A960|nr:YetF domain-containing protein [Tunicatimonas pelagia]WKN43286.1 DUF421 domain-containing protein [Tunicatimonas pelagia]
MDNIFVTNLDSIVRIVVIVPVIYVLVILYIRVIGKRSTSQMNNFDWIVTVAMGSLVASTIILKDVAIVDGALGILLLMVLQYLLTKVMLYSATIRKIVKSTPQLLLYEGEFLPDNMKRERILESEILASIRESGLKNKNQVYAVILETDASFSVIPKENDDEVCFSLADVEGLPSGLKEELKSKGEAA